MYQKSAPESIQAMFASIAKEYDRANTTFSFGLHKRWNQKLISTLGDTIGEIPLLLDLCAGTGEIGLEFLAKYPHSKAILLDFCPEMLAVAAAKGGHFGRNFQERCTLIEGDAQKLPLQNSSIDGATIAYGIRNVKEPLKCFQEVARVLKPGGHFAILELTRPTSTLLRFMHKLYLKGVLPLLGKWVAKNIDAYRYLSKSVEDFTTPDELEKILIESGLRPVKRVALMGGLSTIFVAVRT